MARPVQLDYPQDPSDVRFDQRWDRAGRVGFEGMTRPARRRDLDFLDRLDRRLSGF